MAALSYSILVTLFIGMVVCDNNELSTRPPECVSEGVELWPHLDPNSYWFCQDLNSTPVLMKCTEGRGFLRIENEVSGCAPFEAWKCTSKIGEPDCTIEENRERPHRHVNPNKFWSCTDNPNDKPLAIDCIDFPVIGGQPTYGERGFVSNKDNLGCVPWDKWVCDEANDFHRE